MVSGWWFVMGPVEAGFEKALKLCPWVGPEHGAEVALAKSLARQLDAGQSEARATGAIASSLDRCLSNLLMTPSTSPVKSDAAGSRLVELMAKHGEA